MDPTLFTLGADAPNAALALNRLALGTFFSISGYHKLFDASRHSTLARTLQDDRVRAAFVMQWAVPIVEFCAGTALLVGLLSALAAFGLFVVCAGAVVLDANKRVNSLQPLDRADRIDDLSTYPKCSTASGWRS